MYNSGIPGRKKPWRKYRKGSQYLLPDDNEPTYAAYVGSPPPPKDFTPREGSESTAIVSSTQTIRQVQGLAAYAGLHPRAVARRPAHAAPAFVGRRPQPRDLSAWSQIAREDSEETITVEPGVIGAPLPSERRINASHGSSRSSRSVHSRAEVIYQDLDNEVEETAALIVPGEILPEGAKHDEIPIRLLTDFTIYARHSKEVVPFESLLEAESESLPACRYGASGRVYTWLEEDIGSVTDSEESDVAPDDEDSYTVVSLSTILDISIHHVEDQQAKSFTLDPKIYLRTEFAWYILYVPSMQYYDFYAPLWIKARLFHELVTSVFENRRMSYEDFVGALPTSEASVAADDVLGHKVSKAHFEAEETIAYIISAFNDLQEHDGLHILKALEHTQVFVTIMKPPPSSGSLSRHFTTKHHLRDIANRESTHREKTILTPSVYDIAKMLFEKAQLQVAGSGAVPMKQHNQTTLVYHPEHTGAIHSMVWVEDSRRAPNHYTAVVLDGVRYDAGDCVMVEMGTDANKIRQCNAFSKHSRSSNALANTKWFAKICYFFEQEDRSRTKMFHAQWFQHGAQILLQETAHPHGLFLIDECEDQPLDAIYQKANICEHGFNDNEPTETPSQPNNFFSSVMWDKDNNVFFSRHKKDIDSALLMCKPWRPCVSCGMRRLHVLNDTWIMCLDSLCHKGVDYHMEDFVYVRPNTSITHLYTIGQIKKIKVHGRGQFRVDVEVYGRTALLIRAEAMKSFGPYESDERCLFHTDIILEDVNVQHIEGKVYVLHADFMPSKKMQQWIQHEDHFYFEKHSFSLNSKMTDLLYFDPSDFKHCSKCLKAHQQAIQDEQFVLHTHSKLSGLELFAGAGGLSAGLEQAGFVKTKWAIEWSSSAARTFRANHPDAIVYNQSVNVCLQHAIDSSEGKNLLPLHNCGKPATVLPPMPKPGDVDIIYGGPPCQGFSKMNHTKKSDDSRNTLIGNMISYVDFYRPKFFLLENVRGMFEWKGHPSEGGIEMAAPKFIVRAMIHLGYQVHFRVLNAGHYGAPQSRQRVIYLGARCDLPLPMFPVPTHTLPKDVQKCKLPTGDILYPVVRYRPHDADLDDKLVHCQVAPYPFVTVEDAISDLPQFDWSNPHNIIPQQRQNRLERAKRAQSGFPAFDATTTSDTKYCGWDEETSYPHEPQNRYQSWMRGQHVQGPLTYHYTAKYGSKIVERTVNIPFSANANHDRLPPALRLHKMLNPDNTSKKSYVSLFQRIDGKALFRTALTQVTPNTKGGTVLHPWQKRVITVRECARAQGFPDHWKFLSVHTLPKHKVQDQFTQIGNAVPVPLAFALGKEIRKAVIQMWRDEEARELDERERSPEIPTEIY